MTTAFCPGHLGGRFAFTEIRSSNLVGGGLVHALWSGGVRQSGPALCIRPNTSCSALRVLLGACPSVQVFVQLSPSQGHPLVSSVFILLLAVFLALTLISLPAPSSTRTGTLVP